MFKRNEIIVLILLLTGLFNIAAIFQLKNTLAETSVSDPISAPVTPTSTPYISEPVKPTPTPTKAPTNSSNGGDSSSSSNNGPTVCNDQKPASAPVLLSATISGPNQVTLTWTKAKSPTTYYLVSYGLTPNQMLYGNPNIGNTNTYTVSGLSGNTVYYFKVRAGNGCTPGDFSNTVASNAYGAKIFKPASGFTQGVLGFNKNFNPVFNAAKPNPTSSAFNIPVKENKTFKNVFTSFFKNLFRF